MEQLTRIKARLESLGDLGELVGALRSMAAARVREAQDAFGGTRAYRDVVERAIAEVALLMPDGEGAIRREGVTGRILLVITSENGFVGLFNSQLIQRAMAFREPDEELVIVGRRGQITAAEHGVADSVALPMTTRVKGVTAVARTIARKLSSVGSARIVYARHKAGAAYDIDVRTVLPLAAVPLSQIPMPPIVHIPPEQLLSRLADEYLFAEVAHTLMESLASENGARMRSMDSASRNIEESIERLRRDERVARQEKTTTEMLDVVTGAEAVNH